MCPASAPTGSVCESEPDIPQSVPVKPRSVPDPLWIFSSVLNQLFRQHIRTHVHYPFFGQNSGEVVIVVWPRLLIFQPCKNENSHLGVRGWYSVLSKVFAQSTSEHDGTFHVALRKSTTADIPPSPDAKVHGMPSAMLDNLIQGTLR